MADGSDGHQPRSTLGPKPLANQLDKIRRNHPEDLSGYEKTWLENAANELRHLADCVGGDDDD